VSIPRSAEWHIQRCGRWEVTFWTLSAVLLVVNVLAAIVLGVFLTQLFLVNFTLMGAAYWAERRGKQWTQVQRWEAFNGRESLY
jgi:hypothetical protein